MSRKSLPALWMAAASVFTLAFVSACGSAQTRGPGGVPIDGISFERYDAADTDHDGKLDRDEVNAAFPELSRFFARLDTDKSGYLSWAEMKFFAPRKRR